MIAAHLEHLERLAEQRKRAGFRDVRGQIRGDLGKKPKQ